MTTENTEPPFKKRKINNNIGTFIGVEYDSETKKFYAKCTDNNDGQQYIINGFENGVDAAKCYDQIAFIITKYAKTNANILKLNFPQNFIKQISDNDDDDDDNDDNDGDNDDNVEKKKNDNKDGPKCITTPTVHVFGPQNGNINNKQILNVPQTISNIPNIPNIPKTIYRVIPTNNNDQNRLLLQQQQQQQQQYIAAKIRGTQHPPLQQIYHQPTCTQNEIMNINNNYRHLLLNTNPNHIQQIHVQHGTTSTPQRMIYLTTTNPTTTNIANIAGHNLLNQLIVTPSNQLFTT